MEAQAPSKATAHEDNWFNTTQYQYDADHNVTRVTDPAGKITTFNYDSLYRPTLVTDPMGLTESAAYADGNNPYYPTTLTEPMMRPTSG